jgi:uncharacterized membrane protein
MTYDVQRYQVMENLLMPLAYGRPATITFATVVLAADAEAHEKAAVEAALKLGDYAQALAVCAEWASKNNLIREQAIRDCIQAVKVLGLCNCSALAITADDLHDEWCIERVTVERLALLTEGSES